MLCKVCKVDKRNRDFDGKVDTCKWCIKYMPELNCKDYPEKYKEFEKKLKIKLRKREFDILRQKEVDHSLIDIKRHNKTNNPVAWCDCRMVKLKSISGHYDIVEADKEGYCTKCEHAVQYSLDRPDRNKNLQKFTYNRQYNNWQVYSKNHLKDNDYGFSEHTIHMPKFKEYGEEVFQIQEVRELSDLEIELINIHYNKEKNK